MAFVVGKAVGLVNEASAADYIQLYHGNASLLAEIAWKSSSRPPASSLPHWSRPSQKK